MNTQRTEFFVQLGNREFCLVIKRYPQDGGYNAGETWVEVDEITDAGKRLLVPSVNIPEAQNELIIICDWLREVRARLKSDVRAWLQYRQWAKAEHGGKRAYLTKQANYWKSKIMQSAEYWNLAKLIWKQLTKFPA